MAIIYSYPLNDDIKSLDELVGTTEKIINGQLKTVTRNFLLQDLAEFFIVDGGLQKTITLTTEGDSGVSTLDQVTGVLNIPNYSGGASAIPSLQQVLGIGNEAENAITLTFGGLGQMTHNGFRTTYKDTTDRNITLFYVEGISTGGLAFALPSNKADGGYILATVDDIPILVDSPITIVNGNSLFSTGLSGTGFDSNATDSIFLGQVAGYEATGANNSNFLGFNTGSNAIGAYQSNFLGNNAGSNAADAYDSNFFGYYAGNEAVDARDSNFIGHKAGNEAVGARESNFFGYYAGYQAINASNSNLLGCYAGSSFPDNNIGSNNIIIGTNISLPDATANAINLGGVLFGTGTHSDTTGDPSITPISGGRIGIGVVSPTNTLHIYSETEDTSGLRLERLTSTSPTSTGQAIGVDVDGNVVTVEGGGGATNLSTSQTASNFTINSDTGTDAIVPLGDGALAGATLNDYTTAEKNKLGAISGTNTGDNATNTTSNAYADARVSDAAYDATSWNGVTTVAPSKNAIRDKIQATGLQEITNINATTTNPIFVNSGGITNPITGQTYSGKAIVGIADLGTGVEGSSNTGIGVYGYSEDSVAGEFQTDSVTANIANFKKSGTVLASINNAGELTAQKLKKQGGTSSQILAADGSIITAGNFITITGGQISSVGGTGGGGSSVNYYLNGGTSQGTFVGTTYYEFSKTAVIGTGADFNRNTNGYIASFITDVADPSLLLIPAGNWNLEFFFSSSSAGGSPSFYVELYKYDGTTFTLIASSSATPEGITNGTTIDAYFTPLSVPETVLTVNDRLAIRVYVTASGKTITLHTQNGHLCEVITTFTAGLTALNGLQAQVQNFVISTTGNDFDIISLGSTHTFYLPSANPTARGLVTFGAQTFAGDKTFTGAISASNLSGTNTGDQDLSGLVVKNTAITGATKTKITYDSKGLVTSGADATTADIADSTNKRYVTDANLIVIGNTSNTNTGDQDLSGYALLNSPTFTGTPSLPTGTTGTTQTPLTNSTKIATTQYVDAACAVVAASNGVTVSSQDTFGTNKIATVTAAQYAAFVTAGTISSTTLYFITA